MGTLKYLSITFLVVLSLTSCEDVIELDLDTTDTQLVIEAYIDATAQEARVFLTQTNDFYDNSDQPTISGATITLSNTNGTEYIIPEVASGEYAIDDVLANPNETFIISVRIDDQSYEATAIVPQPVALDSIEILDSAPPFGGDEGDIAISAIWNDPLGVENFYRIRTYVDDVFEADLYTVFRDIANGDGDEQNVPIRERFEEGSNIRLELLSTSEAYYTYFFQISSIGGEGFSSTTPYNPQGNFDNGALGYFGIYTTSNRSIQL